MNGNMMGRPLLISDLIEHAVRNFPQQEIVSRRVEGDYIHRYTYSDAAKRAKKLANALVAYGINQGDRIGTLAWNGYRHFELYYGVSGIGAITHTINPRLFPEQISYIVQHAADRLLFVDLSFVAAVEALAGELSGVERFIIMTDREHMPQTNLPNVLCYEEFIADHEDQIAWPELDEECGAALCYTSGTTGNPKGVLYSNRSTIMHAWAGSSTSAMDLRDDSVVLPVVPMFHVCAWGTPYGALMAGSKLIFPGSGMDGASLYELIDNEKPTLMLGVPTVWLGLLNHVDEISGSLASVRQVVIGGSAVPLSMIEDFDKKHDVFAVQAWGMTEMSPLGTMNVPTAAMKNMPPEERYQLQLKAGRPIYGVDMDIWDDNNKSLDHDGKAFGRLMVRGPWIVERYFGAEKTALDNGWFDTGDVSTIDSTGYMAIVDRSKDVIKSGGEWISSIDLENTAIGHAEVAEACVIGVPHPKWDERPLMFIVKKGESNLDEAEMLAYLSGKIVKWWTPDGIIFVDELPHTATGKLQKFGLRAEYKDHLMSQA